MKIRVYLTFDAQQSPTLVGCCKVTARILASGSIYSQLLLTPVSEDFLLNYPAHRILFFHLQTGAMEYAVFIPGYSGGTAAAFPHCRPVTSMKKIILKMKLLKFSFKSRKYAIKTCIIRNIQHNFKCNWTSARSLDFNSRSALNPDRFTLKNVKEPNTDRIL